MGQVNSPRACIICGSQFYPSCSGSLFVCEDTQCQEEYNGSMDECCDLLGEPIDDEEE